jgi:hypothetical protein
LRERKRNPPASRTEPKKYRYGMLPSRNAAVNNHAAGIVARVGKDDAIEMVKFFLTQNDQFYTMNTHALWICLRDYQKLMVRMRTGAKMTPAQAKQLENMDSNAQAVTQYARKKHERKQQEDGF